VILKGRAHYLSTKARAQRNRIVKLSQQEKQKLLNSNAASQRRTRAKDSNNLRRNAQKGTKAPPSRDISDGFYDITGSVLKQSNINDIQTIECEYEKRWGGGLRMYSNDSKKGCSRNNFGCNATKCYEVGSEQVVEFTRGTRLDPRCRKKRYILHAVAKNVLESVSIWKHELHELADISTGLMERG